MRTAGIVGGMKCKMKSILISIRPEWVEKIASGKKIIEVRKTAPKEVPFKAYIYCTKNKKKADLITKSENFGWIRCAAGALFNRAAEYDANGKVIGEFICDKVYLIKNQGNRFVVANEEQGVTNEIARQSCLDYDDMVDYLDNKDGYGWHISNLKIYDKPKELSEFYRICKNPCKPNKGKILCLTTKSLKMNGCDGKIHLTRPPQSWQYVEELENKQES